MTRWRKSFLFIGVGLSVFSMARAALYFTYRGTFSTISGGKLAFSVIDGVRFDLSILLTAFLVMLFFFNLPFALLMPVSGRGYGDGGCMSSSSF